MTAEIYIWFAEPKPVYGGDGERFIRAWTDNPEKVAALQDAIGREPSVYRAALAAPDALEEIIEARKGMLARLSDVQAADRQTGGTTFYDHEFESCRARIFMAIDAEIERLERIKAAPTGDQS